jgi:glutamyl-tRNA reductase
VRDGRPLTVVDISVPRVVEPPNDPPEGVTVLDLGDFDPILEENKRRREAAIADVEVLIGTYVDRFATWRHEAVILPDVIRLRKMVKQMCAEELEKHADGIPEEAIPAVRKLTEALSERIIKTPIQSLKAQIYEEDPREPLTDFRRLFNLTVVEPEDEVCRSEDIGHPETCEMCAPTGSCVMSRHQSEFAS